MMWKSWRAGLLVLAMVQVQIGFARADGDVVAEAVAAGVPAVDGGVRGVREGDASAVPDRVVGAADVRVVKVRSGVNKIVAVAINHLNRIITPFDVVDVRTADPTAFDLSGGVMYIAPTSETPMSYYMTGSHDEAQAISLTLVPMHVPPVEVRLEFDGGGGGTGGFPVGPRSGGDVAPGYGAGLVQPYVDELRELTRGLALGEIPAGYEMGNLRGRYPYCDATPGFEVDFSRGQFFAGAHFEAVVGVVRRQAGMAMGEFREVWCGRSPGVAAVALWPAVMLSGGQEAEIYVVRRVGETTLVPERPRTARPSLIGGAP